MHQQVQKFKCIWQIMEHGAAHNPAHTPHTDLDYFVVFFAAYTAHILAALCFFVLLKNVSLPHVQDLFK
jgi:hypothetical protein